MRRLVASLSCASVEELRIRIFAFIAYYNRTSNGAFHWTYNGPPALPRLLGNFCEAVLAGAGCHAGRRISWSAGGRPPSRFRMLLRHTEQREVQEVHVPAGELHGRRLRCLHGYEFAEGQVDVAFICGLPYVRMASQFICPVELLAAPVLVGERYQHRPIYFSDVIVHSNIRYTCFDDLLGCVWAYNQLVSHSGCNLVCCSLLERGKTPDYFEETVKSGSHLRPLEMVLEGKADATAIDSHLLDILRARDEELAARLRVVDVLGPSSIPPVVVAKRLDDELKCKLRETLVTMHLDECGAKGLRESLIERFVVVTDEDYGDLRGMLSRVEMVAFPFE